MADVVAALDAAGWGFGLFLLLIALVFGIVAVVDSLVGGSRARSAARQATEQRKAQQAITERERLQTQREGRE